MTLSVHESQQRGIHHGSTVFGVSFVLLQLFQVIGLWAMTIDDWGLALLNNIFDYH